MRKLYYLGLEAYQARYTLQLQEWNERVFKKQHINYEIIQGEELTASKDIVTGSVLDAHGRSYYSLSQHMELIKLMKAGEVTSQDVIFYEDAFTPGIECLPYILQQVPAEYRPKVYVRFLAQSVDPDDFVVREGMLPWMRKYEQLIDEFVDGIFVASEEFVAHLRIAGIKAPIYVTGLPYGKAEVQERITAQGGASFIGQRAKQVAFAARWDDEKQPDFFMDLIEEINDPNISFVLLSGHKTLKSNNPDLVARATKLAARPDVNFKIKTGLTKNEYYKILSESQVLFNCALQDWVSNTVSEADTLGTLTLYPAYRSFPEVFGNNHHHMYTPWSIDDAKNKLLTMLDHAASMHIGELKTMYSLGKISDYQDKTIERSIAIMQGRGDQYLRDSTTFRKYVSTKKL